MPASHGGSEETSANVRRSVEPEAVSSPSSFSEDARRSLCCEQMKHASAQGLGVVVMTERFAPEGASIVEALLAVQISKWDRRHCIAPWKSVEIAGLNQTRGRRLIDPQ